MHIGKVVQKSMATRRHDNCIPLQNHTSATLQKKHNIQLQQHEGNHSKSIT